jgi:putative two-component system response regulator
MDNILGVLNRVEEFSSKHTFQHEKNVGNIVSKLCLKLGLTNKLGTLMELGGHVHDIGKIGIPESILLKPGKLDADELLIMQQHSKIGYDFIKPYLNGDEASVIIANIVLHHHEAFDGSGYPLGMKGEDIPLEARIATVCDIYDALREERPYRPALTHKETIDLMSGENIRNKIDPNIFSAFLLIDT